MNSHEAMTLLIRAALSEDIGTGDITTNYTIPPDHRSTAHLIAKADIVLAGVDVAREVFMIVDPEISFELIYNDGASIPKGTAFATLSGRTHSLLKAERLALNFLQRLSGIATLTRAYVDQVKGTGAAILDTRKTTPLMRDLEKYAVRMGGGSNHRMGLWDGILIKDNHISACGGITEAISKARSASPSRMNIEVECETLDQVQEALSAGADIIMLDNMPIPVMAEAVRLIARRVATEASGNVTLDNVWAIAQSGMDFISVGALTHSAPAADISLRFT